MTMQNSSRKSVKSVPLASLLIFSPPFLGTRPGIVPHHYTVGRFVPLSNPPYFYVEKQHVDLGKIKSNFQ